MRNWICQSFAGIGGVGFDEGMPRMNRGELLAVLEGWFTQAGRQFMGFEAESTEVAASALCP
jgi:hypothetical protein